MKKYTILLDEELVKSALNVSKSNFTDTVRQALKLITSQQAYSSLLKLRGKKKS